MLAVEVACRGTAAMTCALLSVFATRLQTVLLGWLCTAGLILTYPEFTNPATMSIITTVWFSALIRKHTEPWGLFLLIHMWDVLWGHAYWPFGLGFLLVVAAHGDRRWCLWSVFSLAVYHEPSLVLAWLPLGYLLLVYKERLEIKKII